MTTPDRQDDGLLPCPFCGSAPKILGSMHTIYCGADNCFGPATTADNLADAKIQWNTRPPSHDAAEGAGQANLREAWSAMQMIRETIETLEPIGALPASEHLAGPTFMHEAAALVSGIQKMAAPPKPAPDAMRDEGEKIYDRGKHWSPSNPQIAAIFSKPITTDEIISRCYEHGQPDYILAADRIKKLQSEIASLREANNTWVALFGPDGSSSSAFDRAPHNYGEHLPSSDAAANVGEALPSPAVAAEPFAWVVLSDVTGNTRMWTRNGDSAKAFAAKHLLECVELYRSPSLPVQLGAGEREALVERCAKIAEPWPGFYLDDSSTDVDRAVVAVRTEIAEKIRAVRS